MENELMKTLPIVLAGIMLSMLTACNNAEPPKIGVVDVVRIVNESNAGKKANAELDALVKAKQAVIKEKADAAENLKKNLESQSSAAKKTKEEELAAAAAKKAKEEDIIKANAEYQQLVAVSDAEVKRRASELRNKVLEDIKKVVDTIGSEDKFLLILTNENVPYYQKTIDISDKVIKKYNESLEAK
jgi:outer membrane protein